MSELARVKDQEDADGTEDEERTLADLMVQQVEFANVVLLNKTDLLLDRGPSGRTELEAVEALLRKLNPTAQVLRCQHGAAPLEALLNTHLFDMDQAEASEGWRAELAKPAHSPETEEYGVGSLVYRAQRPFHPQRLRRILAGFASLDGFACQNYG